MDASIVYDYSNSIRIIVSRARLTMENGHLIITSASDKNITLRTYGRGYVNVNDENLLHVTQMALRSSEITSRFQKNWGDNVQSSINSLRRQLRSSIIRLSSRITDLEEGRSNETNPQPSPDVNFGNKRTTFLSLTRLFNKVDQLSQELRSVKELLERDECASSPCKNGGTCLDLYNGVHCLCLDNWQGVTCEQDVNECATFAGTDLGCQNGATCVNKPGGYECVCPASLHGLHCTLHSNECTAASSFQLCGHGTCINAHDRSARGFVCLCDEGWKADPVSGSCTLDVDECQSSAHYPCSLEPPVPCINLPGSFHCGYCPQGYSGNGFYCSDIDECASNNGDCSMMPKVQCINIRGSRLCGHCPPGYSGDGVYCNLVQGGRCVVNNGGCSPSAHCLETGGIVTCRCADGFVGSGYGPESCSPSTLALHACHSNPCKNGGTCHPLGSSYVCSCHPHSTGRDCSVTNFASCETIPCQNNGVCSVVRSNFSVTSKCVCPAGFVGDYCEETTGCGGSFTGNVNVGTIEESIGENDLQYVAGPKVCNWRIEVPLDKVVSINFTRLNIDDSPPQCKNNYVEVIDPTNGRFWKLCGSEAKLPHLFSESNFVKVKYYATSKVLGSGFSFAWEAVALRCGGVVTALTHGILQSPGYPEKYPPNMDCEWKVLSSPGKRIQFSFFTVDIEPSDCSKDYLKISNMEDDEPTSLIANYCNSTFPSQVTTAYPSAYLMFHSDSSGSGRGFRATYTVIDGCGGVLTENEGDISPPMADQYKYKDDQDCEWRIQIPLGDKIRIVFNSFDLEFEPCDDFLEVRDGPDRTSPLVGHWCGSALPPPYVSSGNSLTIIFHSDGLLEGGGFNIHYETVCGEEFTSQSGEIRSPNYPLLYQFTSKCAYKISTSPGKAIKLQFQDFLLPDNQLEIYDGDSKNSSKIGSYGNLESPPAMIISSVNYLYMIITDSYNSNARFLANYTTFDIPCGAILKQSTGAFSSPQTEEGYLPNARCMWVISAPPGHTIQLYWHSFHLEYSHQCYADAVEIYENTTASTDGYFIEKYCGLIIPPTISSSTNILTVIFRTNSWVHRDGFSAHYAMTDKSRACGGRFRTPTGVVESPNFPNPYPDNKECIWIIQAPGNQKIRLTFQNFTVGQAGSSSKCFSDNLSIRNGIHSTSPYIGEFCGSDLPGPIISMSNGLWLHFTTDKVGTFSGFKAIWDTTVTGCGGLLKGQKGVITSPNYPEPYYHNAVCEFQIFTAHGSKVKLVIVDLDLEENFNCYKDYIEIYDGPIKRSKSLGRFCLKGKHPHVLHSSKNQLSIKFRSDSSYAGRGFNLEYETECNVTLQGHHGVIESPGFPNPYLPNTNCTWMIQTPFGNKLNLTFARFALEGKEHTDYIEISEGVRDQNPSKTLGTFFGEKFPSLISSELDQVFVKFVSNEEIEMPGFQLEWVVSGCGGIFREKTEGTFSSPNMSDVDWGRPDLECEWRIIAPWSQSIQITVHNTTIQDCNFQSLSVYGGEDDSAPVLLKVCHQQSSLIVVTTSGNHALIVFKSFTHSNDRGFSASFKLVESQCGGYYKSAFGEIHSHNYPYNYDNNDDCEWLIEAPPNHLLNLTFVDFDVEPPHRNISTDFVNVYDGATLDAPLLLSHYGNTLPNPAYVISSNNSLLVRHKSDGSVSAKGFKAQYRVICGGRISAKGSGIIETSELNLANNPHSLLTWNCNCTWYITAEDPADKVRMTFTFLDVSSGSRSELEQQEWISYDSHIVVYDGDDSNDTVLADLRGDKTPPTLQSSGSALTVVLVNPRYGHNLFGRFSAIYSTLSTACGGELTSVHGSIASPGFPDGYPVNADCVWEIKSSIGNLVMLTFTSFELEDSDFCNFDSVEVRSESSNGTLQGVFCGSNIPLNITAANSMWVRFRSNELGTAKGFMAEYSLMHKIDLIGEEGQIASPLYPRPVIQNSNYKWTITVPNNKNVRIVFSDFNIDTYFFGECDLYLRIVDGPDDQTSPNLLNRCGHTPPTPIVSTSNTVTIIFATNSFSSYGSYFKLSWQAVDKTSLELTNSSESLGCGEVIKFGTEGPKSITFTSPGFPLTYPSNSKCSWIIETGSGFHLKLKFNTVDVRNYYNCLIDNLHVYAGSETEESGWQSISTNLCLANTTSLEFEADKSMKVEFKSLGQDPSKSGFSATVNSLCGGNLTAPTGVINSSACLPYDLIRWEIRVRPGRTIKFTFDEFHIPADSTGSCHMAYIKFQNGGHPDSPPLGKSKYCGLTAPSIPESISNRVYISFASYSYNKMVLRYQEVDISCNYEILLGEVTNSTINSPDYPQSPSTPHISCVWLVTAPMGEKVQLDFVSRFDLQYSKTCDVEYIEVRDGGTEISPLIGRYCFKTPSSQISEGNRMYIKYFTDTDLPHNGFKAVVKIASCGGIFHGTQKLTLRSPGYPESYQRNLDCLWKIVGRSFGDITHFRVNITELKLGRERNCSVASDYLEFTSVDPVNKNGSDPSGSTRLCGQMFGGNITSVVLPSSYSEMHIRFRSGSETSPYSFVPRRRFDITIISIHDYCEHEVNAESGVITSLGYPNPAPTSSYIFCMWLITVPEGRRITANLLDVDTEPYVGRMIFQAAIQNLVFFDDHYLLHELPYESKDAANSTYEVESNSNKMAIHYRAMTTSGAHRGFKLEFSSNKPRVCGGPLEANGSFIFSTLNKTMRSFHCEWIRTSDVSLYNQSTFAISINGSLKHNNSVDGWCSGTDEIVTITIIGYNEEIKRIKMCKDTIKPIVVRSPFLKNIISTYKDDEYDGKPSWLHPPATANFSVIYKTQPCGGFISGPEAIVTSPNYPEKYPANADCAWIVVFQTGSRISVKFDDVQLEGDCDHDFVRLYNGDSQLAPHLTPLLCGNNRPGDLKTQDHFLFIEFHSNGIQEYSGFKITLSQDSSGCGGSLHSSKGSLQSPNFGKGDYPSNAECEWTVVLVPGFHAELSFIERFSLEQSQDCKNDFVKIFDYKNNSWEQVGNAMCGRMSPSNIETTSNQFKVLFRTNEKVTSDGFKISWNSVCGSVIRITGAGTITSPNYPRNYPSDLNCNYTLLAPNEVIYLDFQDFKLEDSDDGECQFDKLTINAYDQNRYLYRRVMSMSAIDSYSQVKNQTACGSRAPNPMYGFNKIEILFESDQSINSRGFLVRYYVSSCGGDISWPSVISSPDTSSTSSPYNCTWYITAPQDKVITVKVFETESIRAFWNCDYENVAMYNGHDTENTTNLIDILCLRATKTLTSGGNLMTIQYRHKTNTIRADLKMFRAVVGFTYGEKAGCGGTLVVDSPITLRAPDINGDGTYEPLLSCHWMLLAPASHQFQVSFKKLDIQNCSKAGYPPCSCDALELQDGEREGSPLIGRFCGSSVYPEITSSSDSLVVIFTSDGAIEKTGFELNVRPVLSPCGQALWNVSEVAQTLTSPGYPSNYPNNAHCRWTLLSPPNRQTQLHFTDLDMEGANCTHDYVEISPLNHSTGVHEMRYSPIYRSLKVFPMKLCGKIAHDVVLNNNVQIRFISNGITTGRGFKLEYSLKGCDTNFTASSGRIVIANNRNNITNKDTCKTLIQVQEANKSIALYFNSISCNNRTGFLETWRSYNQKKMIIYDGATEESTELASLCGYKRPKPVFSSGPSLLIVFKYFYDFASVDATYMTTDQGQGCGGRIEDFQGSFTSPLYPATYKQDGACRWDISVPHGKRILFEFMYFDVGPLHSCTTNYIQFFDIDSSTGAETIHSRFCGQDKPAQVQMRGELAFVRYVTTIRNNGTGWDIKFSSQPI